MKNIMFSIIVPVYNAEDYLEESIKSILKQSYKNFELILVDDGSTDNSGIICDKFIKKDARVKVVHQKNQKATKARINGIKQAKGDYIYSVDADDYINENLLEIVKNKIEKFNPDVLMFRYNKVTEDGKIIGEIPKYEKEGFVSKKEFYIKDFKNASLNSVVIKVIKKSKINLEDLEKIDGINQGEDLLLTTTFLKNISQLYLFNDVLYSYRTNPNSIVNVFQINKLRDLLYLHKTLLKNIKEFKDSRLENELYKSYLESTFKYILMLSYQENIDFNKKKEVFEEIREEEFYQECLKYYDKNFGLRNKIIHFFFTKKWDYLMVNLIKIVYKMKKWR